MTTPNGLDSRLTAWLGDEAPARAPDGLLNEVARRAAGTRHRPGWATSERWIPMETRAQLGAIPRTAILLVTLGLLLAAFAAIALGATGTPAPNLPPPFGLAGNGLIAYDSGGDIWLMQADGTDRRRVTQGPDIDLVPTWSRDGTRLAFWSWPVEAAPSAGQSSPSTLMSHLKATDRGSLVVTEADGSHRQVLASDVSLSGGSLAVAWAPDDRRIAITRANGIAVAMDVVSLDGSPVVHLGPGQDPAWSPDGTTIAFRAQPGIMLVDAGGNSSARRLTTMVAWDGYDFARPLWSPDGSKILFYAQGHDIWVVDTATGTERQVTTDSADEYWPAWSPDGTRIAFSRVLDPGNRPRFVVVDADGSNESLLGTTPEAEGLDPAWSPDGTLLVGGVPDPANPSGWILHLLPVSNEGPIQAIPITDSLGYTTWQRLALE